MPAKRPVCLTIAGLDPSGGAGLLADIKTFSAFGCYGAAAVTSITFQNTVGVFGAEHVSAENLRRQLDPVFDDFDVATVKTGMLPTAEIIETVARIIEEQHSGPFVVDPVVRSTSGFDLIDDAALAILCRRLFPLATVVTPNLPEAERIAGFPITGEDDLKRSAETMLGMGAGAVLIKGGHDSGDTVRDTLFTTERSEHFDAERIDTTSTHGTGCTLASAITAELALGKDLTDAVASAKAYVTAAIKEAPKLGRGHGPVDHLVKG